jgi:hypothetical protein
VSVIFALRQQLHDVPQLQLDDPLDLPSAQRAEHHDVVDAVQKLRPEEFPQSAHRQLSRLLGILSPTARK